LTAELGRLCNRLRKPGDSLRWSAPEGWHITLQFLGSADEAQFESLKVRLTEVRSGPVPVRMGDLEVFDRAGAFVVEVATSLELRELQQRVVEATKKCGFVPEDRPYHPHITLARAKGDARRQLRQLKARIQSAPALPAFVAAEFLLYESHLGLGGSKYVAQARFMLSR
jgi:2'-5' RNA ligase